MLCSLLIANQPSDDWNQLLLDARSGNEAARNRLFGVLQVRLRPVVQSRLRGWAAAEHEDLLQNTLIVVVEKLAEIESNPHHFALRVLRNKIGDLLRAGAVRRFQPLEADDEGDSPIRAIAAEQEDLDEAIDASRLTNRMVAAIRKLSQICQLFFSAALQGQSVNEIWDLFARTEPGLKRSAFDKRLFDCRKRLRRELEGLT